MKTIEKIRRIAFMTVIAALTAAMHASCNSDDDNEPAAPKAEALVTFDGNIGENAYFTYLSKDDGPTLTLYSSRKMPEDINKGQRMVISYNPGTQGINNSGMIELMSYRTVPTEVVQVVPTAEAQAANAAMNLYEIYRTGTYINVNATLPIVEGRTFSIYADEATMESGMPHLYVTTTAPTGDAPYKLAVLSSYDITSVWRNPSVRGVTVHINNTSSDTKTFEFLK